MLFRVALKVGFLLLMVISLCQAQTEPYYYYKGMPSMINVDQSKYFIKFIGIGPDEAIPLLLNAYPSLSYDSTDQLGIEIFFQFDLSDTSIYDSILSELRTEEYIAFANPVGMVGDSIPVYIAESFVCRFSPIVSRGEIDNLLAEYDLEIVEENEYMPGEYLIRLTPQNPSTTIDVANSFYELPETEYSHPNFYCPVTIDGYTVNDEYYNLHQANLKTVVGKAGYENAAWEITTGDTAIYIGIIDQGIEPHEDFDTTKFWYGYDFVGTSGLTFFPLPTDTAEVHGISVVGLISAEHNNPVEGIYPDDPDVYKSIAGVSPKCRPFVTRLLKKGFTYVDNFGVSLAIGFTFRNGADVINCSWTWYGGAYDNIENTIDSAFVYGRDGKGTLMIFSSGNYHPFFHYDILWPKTKDNVLTVGAIDGDDYWYDYSCYGSALDLIAPSGISYVDGQPYSGEGVWTTDRMGLMGENPDGFDGCMPVNDIDYRCTFGGTSAAAPLVTGTAALILSKRPELTAAQLMDVLKQSAVTNLDWGSITTPDEKYGYGRVNAFRALVAVARGDANNSGLIEVADAVYLINYIFKDGSEPVPHYLMGDFNCDGMVNVGDAVCVIAYVFRGGPAPEVCTDHLP